MWGKFYNAKLPLAQIITDGVKVVNISKTNSLSHRISPFLL